MTLDRFGASEIRQSREVTGSGLDVCSVLRCLGSNNKEALAINNGTLFSGFRAILFARRRSILFIRCRLIPRLQNIAKIQSPILRVVLGRFYDANATQANGEQKSFGTRSICDERRIGVNL